MSNRVWILGVATGVAMTFSPLAATGAGVTPPGCAPATAPCTTRVSVPDPSTGQAQADKQSSRANISSDGRYVAFYSIATNLTNDPKGSGFQVYLRDVDGAHTYMVSRASGGANGHSSFPDVSSGGHYVAFESTATNLPSTPADTNAASSVFRADMSAVLAGTSMQPTIEQVSVNSAGTGPATGFATRTTISNDGCLVAFNSNGTDLVSGVTTGGHQQVYVRNMCATTVHGITAHTTKLVSHASSNATVGGSADSIRGQISGDGSHIAFISSAGLSANDSNGQLDVYEWAAPDQVNGGSVRLVSQGMGGVAGNGLSTRPDISDNGDYVAFQSDASDLVAGDTNGQSDIFRAQMSSTGTPLSAPAIRLVDVRYDGTQTAVASTRAAISGDGRLVAFATGDHKIVPGDTNSDRDVFVRDMSASGIANRVVSVDWQTGQPGTSICAAAAAGQARTGSGDVSTRPSLDHAGDRIVIVSGFCDLVPNDTNGVDDVFLRVLS
jgi:Tol biopolymer transport system component